MNRPSSPASIHPSNRIGPGTEIDGFRVGERVHVGAMAYLHHAERADGRDAAFPMLMKVPRMSVLDGSENLIGFEIEQQLLQLLQGPGVPRFVAAGDLSSAPWLVMERVPGETLANRMDRHHAPNPPMATAEIARIGAQLAQAAHGLHRQDVCHLDLKPANVILHPDGHVVLVDFGLSWHAAYPDLLADEHRRAVGSPAWIAPEQVVGVRGDPRSDIFAIGVILYEMATGELPFGSPGTDAGMRQRLWMDPRPPRALRPDLPEWLQEVILRCLEPLADQRYPSASHLAFDLHHPEQVRVGERGRRMRATGAWAHLRRWLRSTGMHYRPSPLPTQQIAQVPIVMVAVPEHDLGDAEGRALRQAVSRSLGTRPGATLAVVTVVPSGGTGMPDADRSETAVYRQHLLRLQQWAGPLDLERHQASFHVIESGDVARALLRYAEGNQVTLVILGAGRPGQSWSRFVTTVPARVSMLAPCTVLLVRERAAYGS